MRKALLALFLTACGLDVVGAASAVDGGVAPPVPASDGEAPPGPVLDGGPEPVPDAGPCASNACATLALPAGWSPVAVRFGSEVTTCPAGFGAATILRESPIAAAGVCGCAVNEAQSTPPGCITGTLTFETGGGCNSTGVSATIAGGCQAINGTVSSNVRYAQFPAVGGTCVADVTIDRAKVTSTAATLCAPQACPDDVCAQKPPAGYRACVVADGVKGCPATGGFGEQHVVGEVELVCSACGCTPSGTCSNVNVALFDQSNCTGKITDLPANTCNPMGAATGRSVASVLYTAVPISTHTATGPKTATVGLRVPRTVCCAP